MLLIQATLTRSKSRWMIVRRIGMDMFRKGRGEDQEFTMRPAIPGLRNLIIGAVTVLVVILALSFLVRVTRIEAGHVGVEINLAGSQPGASEIPVRPGWVVYSPLRTQIIEFPTYVQTVKWTRDVAEGHPADEEMDFNSKEGMDIRVDVSLSYGIDPRMARDFFVKSRVRVLEMFSHG